MYFNRCIRRYGHQAQGSSGDSMLVPRNLMFPKEDAFLTMNTDCPPP